MSLANEMKNQLPQFLPRQLLLEASILRLGRGERLFQLGDPVQQVYFVVEGELKAVRYQPDGRESILLRSQPGEFFGESALVVEHYVCEAFSTRDSAVFSIPAQRFREMLNTDVDFASAFAKLMAATARRQCSRYERLRLGRARDRVLHLLSCEADSTGLYPLNGPLVNLADELGLEPETLYRVLKELEREKVIARPVGALQLSARP